MLKVPSLFLKTGFLPVERVEALRNYQKRCLKKFFWSVTETPKYHSDGFKKPVFVNGFANS